MKKIFNPVFYTLILSVGLICSCKNELMTVLESNTQPPVEYIEYKGQQVVIPSGYPKELFNQSPKEFSEYIQRLLQENRSRNAEERFTIPYEDLKIILQKWVDLYPRITLDNVISENDMGRIYSDFPNINSLAEIDSNRSVIFDYYQDLCKRDVVLEAINYQFSGQNSKILSPGTPLWPRINTPTFQSSLCFTIY